MYVEFDSFLCPKVIVSHTPTPAWVNDMVRT